MRERVAVWDSTVTICGAAYLGGTGFFFRDLSGELVKLEARDVTGRGRADVIVRRKQSVGDAEREYLEVLSAPSATDEPARDVRARDRGPAVASTASTTRFTWREARSR